MSNSDHIPLDDITHLVLIPPDDLKLSENRIIRGLDALANDLPQEFRARLYESAENLFAQGANVGAFIGFAFVCGTHREKDINHYNEARKEIIRYLHEKTDTPQNLSFPNVIKSCS